MLQIQTTFGPWLQVSGNFIFLTTCRPTERCQVRLRRDVVSISSKSSRFPLCRFYPHSAAAQIWKTDKRRNTIYFYQDRVVATLCTGKPEVQSDLVLPIPVRPSRRRQIGRHSACRDLSSLFQSPGGVGRVNVIFYNAGKINGELRSVNDEVACEMISTSWMLHKSPVPWDMWTSLKVAGSSNCCQEWASQASCAIPRRVSIFHCRVTF